MKSWRLLNSIMRECEKAIPSQPAQLHFCVKCVCLEAIVVLEPLASWQGGEKTLSHVPHLFIALREFLLVLNEELGS